MGKRDGGIVVAVDLDDRQAQKELIALQKKIEQTEQKINDMQAERDKAHQEAVFKATELDAEKEKLEQIRLKLQELKAAAKDTNLSETARADANSQASNVQAKLKEQQERVGLLQTAYNKVAGSVERYDEKISKASTELDRQKEKAGELVQEISAAPGYSKRMATAMSSVRRVIGRTVETMMTLGQNVTSVVKNMNVFSRLSSGLSEKLKRIGQTIKTALVFSTINKGLSYMKEQIGAYIKTNSDFMTALGQLKGALLTAFQPIYSAAMPALSAILNTLTRIVSAVAQFTAALFGTTAKTAQANAKALYEQAEALEATGGAASEAAGSLASFDEINTLSSQGSGGGGTSAGNTIFASGMSDESFDSWGSAFDSFLDRILNSGIPRLREGLNNFSEWLNGFSEKLYEMFTFPGVKDKIILLGCEIAKAFNDMVSGIDWSTLGASLGAGLNLAVLFAVSLIYNFDWIQLGESVAEALNGAISQIDWYAVGQLLWAGFKIAIETLAGIIMGIDEVSLAEAASDIVIGFVTSIEQTLENIDWATIGEKIGNFLTNLDWGGMAESVFEAIGEAFEAAIDLLFGAIIAVWDKVVEWWHDAAYEDGEFTIEGLLDGIDEALLGIYNWLKEHIIDPIVNGVKKLLGINSPSTVMKEVGEFTMQGMLDGLSSKTEKVKELFSNLWSDIKTWWNTDVSEFFTLQYWKDLGSDMITGLMDGLSGIFSKIKTWASDVWTNITNGISGNASTSGYGISVSSMPTSTTYSVPGLATGAVIPPNREFLAILGDQTSGTNIETPESLLRKIIREETEDSDALYVLRDILTAVREGKNLVVDKRVLGKVASEAITERARASGKAVVTT